MENDTLQPIIITTQCRNRPPRRRRIRPWPYLFRALLLAFGIVAVGYVAVTAFNPVASLYHQKQETRRLNHDLNRALDTNKSLRHEAGLLRSGQGLEREARSIGYLRPGEVSLHVTTPPPEPKNSRRRSDRNSSPPRASSPSGRR